MLLKLKDAITLFEWCSELKVNWEKSALSSVNVVEDDLVQTANRLGCMAEKLPFLYLGLPLRDYPRQKEFWQLVVDQIHKKLDRWKRFNMSRGSRHALNNPVQASSHLLSIFIFNPRKCGCLFGANYEEFLLGRLCWWKN